MSLWNKHAIFEKNSIILSIGILIVVSIGGLVEIGPLFYLKNTIETVGGVRPYTPLELEGRDIYVREGCYLCHSQMIRALRDEVERYGHYSLAAESKYDHPFLWGSKRTGPELSRIGGKYSDDWHRAHLNNPRAVVPGSVMPRYGFLAKSPLDYKHVQEKMRVLRIEGVPYTDEDIAKADADIKAQLSPDDPSVAELDKRYPKAVAHTSLGGAATPTEQDAVVAYLQMLGTTVDFKLFDEKANWR